MDEISHHIIESLDSLRKVNGGDVEAGPFTLLCESGDVIAIDVCPSGILVTLDDCNATALPTAMLEPKEVYRLVSQLLRCAQYVAEHSSAHPEQP